jgi:pre-mRNA-splicing factor SYF1
MASEWARRLVASAEDVAHEEALLRDPLSLKNWLFYLELKRGAPPELRFTLYERAVRRLPGSYKLWFRYLTERRAACQGRAPRDRLFEEANNAHERALVFMGKYPRIWLDYLGFLAAQHKVTATRKAFDRALQALPITQHHRVWPLYLEFARGCGVPETGMRVYRRLLKLEPQRAEEFVAFLLEHGKRDEAAQQLAALLNDDRFVSQQGKSKQDLWNEFVALVTRHPEEVTSLDADAIIRAGIKRLPHEVGRLWVALADYYTRRGLFEKARDVFEEGLGTVATARDFAQVFDAYTEFEEGLLQAKMAALEEGEEAARARPSGEVGDEAGNLDEDFELAPEDEVELRMARLDDLVQRRPFLLNSALLRQNPHSVAEWMRRVRLFRDDHEQVVLTFSEAVTTVDPAQAVGKPHLLWLAFARYYALRLGDLDSAREVLRKATLVNFRSVDDLASVWCQVSAAPRRAAGDREGRAQGTGR